MRIRRLAVALAVSTIIVLWAGAGTAYASLNYAEVAVAEAIPGQMAISSGIAANIYIYQDWDMAYPDSGKVNSIYLRSLDLNELVEAGYVTNAGLTVNNHPGTAYGETKAFAWYRNRLGQDVVGDPYWLGTATTGEAPAVQVRYFSQAQGATYPNTISVWVRGVRKLDFTRLGYTSGYMWWGTEQQNPDTTLGGSFAESKYYTGSQWFYLQYGRMYQDEDEYVHFEDRLLLSQHKAMFEAGNQ